MLTTSFEAKSCSAPVILSDRPRLRTREAYTLTAVATELRFGADGRRIARLNAFVDGLGPRTVHIELGADEYDRVSRTMTHPGTLIRASGELVHEGPRLMLLHTQGLQFLEPDPGEGIYD